MPQPVRQQRALSSWCLQRRWPCAAHSVAASACDTATPRPVLRSTGSRSLGRLCLRVQTDMHELPLSAQHRTAPLCALSTHIGAIRKAGAKPLLLALILFGWLIVGGALINRWVPALLG